MNASSSPNINLTSPQDTEVDLTIYSHFLEKNSSHPTNHQWDIRKQGEYTPFQNEKKPETETVANRIEVSCFPLDHPSTVNQKKGVLEDGRISNFQFNQLVFFEYSCLVFSLVCIVLSIFYVFLFLFPNSKYDSDLTHKMEEINFLILYLINFVTFIQIGITYLRYQA